MGSLQYLNLVVLDFFEAGYEYVYYIQLGLFHGPDGGDTQTDNTMTIINAIPAEVLVK